MTLTAISLLCCLTALSAAEDTGMPLKYFRNSGIQASMNSTEAWFAKFQALYETSGSQETIGIESGNDKINVLGGMNIGDIQRSSLSSMLPHAACNPYDQVIEIPNSKPNVLLYPSCVVLKQCGGCCGHPDLMCKPTETAVKKVQVTKYVYDGQQAHPVERVDVAEVVEHKACQCSCKITAADCDSNLHDFDDWNCACTCKQGQQTCGPNMRWDDSLCACRCSSVQNCGTGYTYNLVTCSCEAVNDRTSGISGGNTNTNNNQPIEQEDTRIEETVDKADPCDHLICSMRNYAPVMSGGTCKCKFSRTSRRGRK